MKTLTCVNKFKEMCSNLSLPPLPVITRWETWLDVVFYNGKHFEKIYTFHSFCFN